MATEEEVTPEMIAAGLVAWGRESGFYGPPDVPAEPVLTAIYKAMAEAKAKALKPS